MQINQKPNANRDHVILVNQYDTEIGTLSKLEAHEKGLLHRAISVFIVNDKGEWLMQKRADHKYHSSGLWSNTCCSHPHPGENNMEAASRRLHEEMGLNTTLTEVFHFTYFANLENDLKEHELDHVFIGFSNDQPALNPDEASDAKWMSFQEIEREIKRDPDQFSYWFRMIYEQVFYRIGHARFELQELRKSA